MDAHYQMYYLPLMRQAVLHTVTSRILTDFGQLQSLRYISQNKASFMWKTCVESFQAAQNLSVTSDIMFINLSSLPVCYNTGVSQNVAHLHKWRGFAIKHEV